MEQGRSESSIYKWLCISHNYSESFQRIVTYSFPLLSLMTKLLHLFEPVICRLARLQMYHWNINISLTIYSNRNSDFFPCQHIDLNCLPLHSVMCLSTLVSLAFSSCILCHIVKPLTRSNQGHQNSHSYIDLKVQLFPFKGHKYKLQNSSFCFVRMKMTV